LGAGADFSAVMIRLPSAAHDPLNGER